MVVATIWCTVIEWVVIRVSIAGALWDYRNEKILQDSTRVQLKDSPPWKDVQKFKYH